MPNLRMLQAAVVAAALVLPSSGFSASVDIEQIQLDKTFELAGSPADNTATNVADAADVQNDPEGLNVESGEENQQKNSSVIEPTALETNILQRSVNNRFNTGASDADYATVHNAAIVDISATEELVHDVGINTAAGAFNLQVNSSVIALTSDVLAQSATDTRQDSLLNAALVQGVTNEVFSTIVLDAAEVNVGINTVAGTGNEQINTSRMTTAF